MAIPSNSSAMATNSTNSEIHQSKSKLHQIRTSLKATTPRPQRASRYARYAVTPLRRKLDNEALQPPYRHSS
eukprot:CAMPEP_0184524606 /NCGR_PEP_ID=MMETSP0198_2-20121128/9617_1 /TAXON_ID=1112570 /ORGANISM="Thraustochytrium sp., Strain LLF1b" /LENGTH=71 /DNA_ID=CAMNT_0026915935 /DNA_START=853 /DNA_END=1065 /DNA_ORIENTATION=-